MNDSKEIASFDFSTRSNSLPLRPGEEIVTAPAREAHLLRASLAEMKRRGEIVNAYNWTERGREVGVIIERNPAYRRIVPPNFWIYVGSFAALSLAAVVARLLWEARNLLAMAAGAAAVLVAVGIILHVTFGGGSGCSCIVHGKACR